MIQKEWILNIGLCLLGAVFVVESLNLGLGDIHHPGPGFLPFFTGLGLGCAALMRLVRGFGGRRNRPAIEERFFPPSALNVFIVILSIGLYVLLLPHSGFSLSTFLLLCFLFKAGGFRKWRFIFLSSVATVFVTYWLFSHWLGIRFPKGFIGF